MTAPYHNIYIVLAILCIKLLDRAALCEITDVALNMEFGSEPRPFFTNPSVFWTNTRQLIAAARLASIKQNGRYEKWTNSAYLCSALHGMQGDFSCQLFDPWHGYYQECEWGGGGRADRTDTTGKCRHKNNALMPP